MSRKSKQKARPGKAAAMPSGTAGLNDRWTVLGVCVFLAAIVWAVFGQTLHHGFVNYDDGLYVSDNPTILRGLSLKGIAWAFTHSVNFNWTPLTMISHMLDCQIYGLNAGGHHLTSVLLHMASAIVLFLVLKEMTSALWRSAFVAAVFAIHPLHVESVAWIAERRDVLSGLFFMLTLGAYVRYARRPWSLGRYLMVALMLVLGLMSKPMVVTLPFVLLLLDYWPLKRFNQPDGHSVTRRLILEKIPLLAVSGAACVATLFAQQEAITPLPLALRIGNAVVSYVAYIGQMIYPAGLVVYYPHPGSSLPLWKIIAAFILLLGISAGALATRRKHSYFLFGWLWYLGMLVPVIGLIQSGLRAQADRYTYLPQIGLYLLLTWTVADLSAGWRHRRWLLGSLSTVILTALIFCARAQTFYWRNSEALWTHTLACTSDNSIAQNNFGVVLLQKGNIEEAITHFQTALAINPDYTEAHNNLGYALFQKGSVDEAISQYQQALQINPDYANAHNNFGTALIQKGNVDEAIIQYQRALQINPDDAEVHNNLGVVLLQTGKIDEAITHFQQALQTKPDYVEAQNNLGSALLRKGKVDEAIVHYQLALQIKPDIAEANYNLGSALFQRGNVDEAIAHFKMALQIKPGYAKAHYSLGSALLQKGRMEEAIVHYQQALQINPDYAEAKNDLAWVLATAPQASLRNGNQAVELAQQANQIAGGENPTILRILAAAYAEAGRFGDAQQNAQKALDLARAAGQTDLINQISGELKLYDAGLPFHQEGK